MTQTVRVTFASTASRGAASVTSPLVKAPPFRLVSENGSVLDLPIGPRIARDGYGITYDQYERIGRKPILASKGRGLKTLSLSIVVLGRDATGSLDYLVPVGAIVARLRTFSVTGERVRIENYIEAGWFRVTAISDEDIMYAPPDNQLVRSSVSLTLTEASDIKLAVGPLSGGVKTAPQVPDSVLSQTTPTTSATATTATATPTLFHTVVSGDTLWKIAQKFYGDGSLWPRIADANGVKDARTLAIGQKLEIPPK